MEGKLKQTKGITLIALVITIIVLLILAGVSIAMLTGQNGILTQATNAKVEQSHGAIREGIALAYNEYQIEINTASNTKLASTETVQIQGREEKALASYSSFLDFLVQKGYATLDEDDETHETTGIINVTALTGSKQALGNGTDTDVYKVEKENGMYIVNYYDEKGTSEEIWSIVNNQSSTDNVEINITKTNLPDDQNVGAVLLTVDKVLQNGSESSLTMQVTEEEYENMLLEKLEKMTDEEKGTMILELFNMIGTPFKDINELIEYAYNQGSISENTEEAFYEYVETNHHEFVNMIYKINYNLIGSYDKETGELQRYTVTNPDEEKSNTYLATQNGDYDFTVEIDGKKYAETENVNNITISQESNNYKVENIDENVDEIGLKDMEKNDYTTFSNAYVIYNGQIIDVTGAIINENNISLMNAFDVEDIIWEAISVEFMNPVVDVVIVKDGQYYYGKIEIPEAS